MSKKNLAFTLVELAIVLIVIGLITAGVIGAQSLIKSSERQNAINYINRLDSMTHFFKGEYGCWPGDCRDAVSWFGTDVQNGNGNNVIDYYSTAPWEYVAYFEHLSKAELINEDLDGVRNHPDCGGDQLCPGKNIPTDKYFDTFLVPYNAYACGGGSSKNDIQLITMANQTLSWGRWLQSDASFIDKKIDDGIRGSGKLCGYGGSSYNLTHSNASTVIFYSINKRY